MPDFEHLTRELEVSLSRRPEIVKARHEGEDRARRQIALIVAVIAAVALSAYALLP